MRTSNTTAGYTLIEVMVAAMILALASFGLMGLLRASDQMGYRARVNGVVSNILSTRARQLVSFSYADLKAASLASGDTFQRGATTAGPNIYTFPFLVPGESPSSLTATNYLAYGKPLPGDTTPRGIFPFVEYVFLTFDPGGFVTVKYDLAWTDSYTGTPGEHAVFSFNKYDPTRF